LYFSRPYSHYLYATFFALWGADGIGYNNQEFSFGGEADSTYEYFLKEYLLLGGTREQYRNLYIDSVQAAEEYLFFRPLVQGDPEIMFSGKYRSLYDEDGGPLGGELIGEMQHLVLKP